MQTQQGGIRVYHSRVRFGRALFGLAVVLAGCSAKPPNAPRLRVLCYPLPAKPTTLDPGKVQDGDTISILGQVYEGLVAWNEKGEIIPVLADRWDVSPDLRTYTFHLRPGAKFSDGRPVTASDFKQCFERNCGPELASVTARTFLNDIVGARDRMDGKRSDIPGVVAVDANTLQLTIDQPRPYFLEKLTVPVANVFAKHELSNRYQETLRSEEMVGTGAFKFETVNVDQQVNLVPNELYWAGTPHLDRIERPIVADAATRLAMYKSGQANHLRLEREDVPTIEKDPVLSKQLRLFPRPALWYFGIDGELTKGFEKEAVRRAIAMAIDKTRIVKDVLQDVNPAANGIVPPSVFGHRDGDLTLPYDPSGARKLLADAGYPGGRGLPEVTIWFRTNRPDLKLVAEAVGQDLAENLGLKVSFKGVDWTHLLEALNARRVPFVLQRWSADFPDAADFLSTLLSSKSAGNVLGYSNAEFDSLCARADSTVDPKERLQLYGQAEDIAIHDAPMTPICFERDAELTSPHVHGIRITLIGHMPHDQVTVQ